MKVKEMWEAEDNIKTAKTKEEKLQLEIVYSQKVIAYYESDECGTREECRAKHIGTHKKMIERRQQKLKEMKEGK